MRPVPAGSATCRRRPSSKRSGSPGRTNSSLGMGSAIRWIPAGFLAAAPTPPGRESHWDRAPFGDFLAGCGAPQTVLRPRSPPASSFVAYLCAPAVRLTSERKRKSAGRVLRSAKCAQTEVGLIRQQVHRPPWNVGGNLLGSCEVLSPPGPALRLRPSWALSPSARALSSGGTLLGSCEPFSPPGPTRRLRPSCASSAAVRALSCGVLYYLAADCTQQ